ncbi:MAG: PAS domain S-box protein [Planctomycetes bacterium]|nr:PAS domain S-box protein [Planctomycetota bacterium]
MAQAFDMDLLAKLTEREIEVLQYISAGLTNTQIARRLHCSVKTVEWHRTSLRRKLGAANRVDLACIAIQAGIGSLASPEAAAAVGPGELTSDEAFRQLAENIDQVFWLTDWTKRELLYVNPAYETVYRRSCQSLYDDRHSWLDQIHPQEKPRVAESFARNAQLGLSVEAEYRIIHADGSTRWIRDRALPIRDEAGNVSRIVGLAEDITEHKRAEEALRVSQFSLDCAPDAVFWVGPDARFVYVNAAATRALGYSRDELLSMTVPDIDPKFPAEAWADHWQEVKQRGSFHLESLHRAKDGRIFPVEITVNYLELAGKAFNCACVREITERRRAVDTPGGS